MENLVGTQLCHNTVKKQGKKQLPNNIETQAHNVVWKRPSSDNARVFLNCEDVYLLTCVLFIAFFTFAFQVEIDLCHYAQLVFRQHRPFISYFTVDKGEDLFILPPVRILLCIKHM